MSVVSPSPSPGPSTPSITASTNIPEPTVTHLLSLPASLAPLSPPLAALHLARLRLLLSVPATPHYRGAGGLGTGGWCHLCGSLRSGLGGAERGCRSAGASAAPVKPSQPVKGSNVSKRAAKGSRGRKAAVAAVDRSSTAEEITVVPGSQATTPAVAPDTQRKRKPAECETCGASYKRPRPDPVTLASFQPARRTRRQTAAEGILTPSSERDGENVAPAQQALAAMSSSGMVTSAAGLSDTSTAAIARPDAATQPSSMARQHAEGVTNNAPGPGTPSTTSVEPTQPPALLSRPSLAHIPKSSPNLPTYPPPSPSTLPSVTSGAGSGSAPGAKPPGAKKKKKSGLAKLLAENKERESASASKGMWGLG
ncbi:hypothetical protein IAU60_004688 [Kwoniella sp. DSM 27419]